MGLLGDLLDLGSEVVSTAGEAVKAVTTPVKEVAEDVVKEVTNVVRDVKDEIKGE